MGAALTLSDTIQYFSEYERCREFLIQARWPDGVVCPECGAEKVTYLERARVWKCYGKHPQARFSLKTGTVFEDSPVPLEKWLPVAWVMLATRMKMSSRDLQLALGVTQKTAWFMVYRIGRAMKSRSFRRARTKTRQRTSAGFEKFARAMTRLFAVKKSELDESVVAARAESKRFKNPKSAGRKPVRKR